MLSVFIPSFRNLPRANIIGVLLVTTLYVLTNISYLVVLGVDGLLNSEAVAVVSYASCNCVNSQTCIQWPLNGT